MKIASNCQSSKVWKGLAVISSKDARLQYQNIFTGNSKAFDCRLKTHNLQYLSRILLKLFQLFIVSSHSWWLYTWTWTAGLFWRRFGFLLNKKINATLNCFTEYHNHFVDSNFHDSLNSVWESRSNYYGTGHKYNKILKSDWLSTVLISALIGKCNRTEHVMPCGRLIL